MAYIHIDQYLPNQKFKNSYSSHIKNLTLLFLLKSSEDVIFYTLWGINFALNGMFCSFLKFCWSVRKLWHSRFCLNMLRGVKSNMFDPVGTLSSGYFNNSGLSDFDCSNRAEGRGDYCVNHLSGKPMSLKPWSSIALIRVCKLGVEKERRYLWKLCVISASQKRQCSIESLGASCFYKFLRVQMGRSMGLLTLAKHAQCRFVSRMTTWKLRWRELTKH